MKNYLDCIPCFMSQALRAGKTAGLEDKQIKKLLDEVGMMISDIPMESSPPETGAVIYQKIREITGIDDPFLSIKQKNTREALDMYPELRQLVRRSDDPLLMAIRLAIAGNVIDFGVNKAFNLQKDIEQILSQDFAIFDYDSFRESLRKTEKVYYLGDNAGESVFDRILIEELHKPVVFVVREIPVINDVTRADAIMAGLDKVAEIVSSGSTAPGNVPALCDPSFMETLYQADMIISKGQGNYEGLSDEPIPVFFLLKVKCHVIARDLGVTENSIVLKKSDFKHL
ncbi:MAG TPA: DUF89 family protein [Bacteroidetes bacterium]|nr:DUF89 family protein [Bacteroidota bacterium]